MSFRRLLLLAIALLLVGGGAFLVWVMRATPTVRDRVVETLNERFDSKVDMTSLQVAVFPRPHLWGTGLILRYDGRTDIPPLITIDSFNASAGFRGVLRAPLHLRDVAVEGLDIRVPPGGLNGDSDDDDDDEPRRPKDTPPPVVQVKRPGKPPFLIDSFTSRQARLEIASHRKNRLPRIFDIENLTMKGFGLPDGAPFQAALINPKPRGRIETNGKFGPWNPAEPDLTPISGDYTFKDANLNDIKGIAGTLAAVGTYSGVLERVDVVGTTETPDFSIDIAGQQVPLTTKFRAVVDGTNGDTWLEQVEATLGRTTILAKGAVVRTQNVKGRRVSLDLRIQQGRIEDLMRLAVKSANNPLLGRIDLDTRFLLPQGPADVVDRLQLNGTFKLRQARFTSIDVQKKINLISSRGSGDEDADGTGESVVSNMQGKFTLRDARLAFSDLTFTVPGATVQLSGTYNLRDELMDFTGYFLTDASLAEMTSGVKAMLARLAQPFFRRPGGGSKIPIRISGPRSKPKFGLDVKRVFKKE
jgi:hypothetical protein